ncbi:MULTISPECIES: MotA/TolQ/ExbB proton channel family protein [Corallococcus]|uniref:MotA/TolQ/ExbB proton channel family protein n=1 Tax=Corallococcus TaxID=83461 RepID=UPI00117DD757|nr:MULTISPECIES: MotA/TolQ/ExbB proton channel family protein [Corallococcus]NBD08767.1 MotA/TolQ/ExbB proton channel family protein [Corallococcus silvisoli]TSC32725.1 MotA/TolQ/ExbB proton channel family protein [Corallococcus sp. Z5C101001]
MMLEKMHGAVQMGSTAVLWLLIALSVMSVGVVVDRIVYFHKRRVDPRKLGRALVERLRAGDVAGARAVLAHHKSIEAQVLTEALEWYADGADAVAEILGSGLKDRRPQFESGLLFLGTLANNSPFIGLFGTVLGIITAFKELGSAQAGGGGMGNVMGGIAEALIATAVGILVALPAVVAFNYFQKKCNEVEDNVATLGGQLLAHLRSAHPARTTTEAPSNGAAALAARSPVREREVQT